MENMETAEKLMSVEELDAIGWQPAPYAYEGSRRGGKIVKPHFIYVAVEEGLDTVRGQPLSNTEEAMLEENGKQIKVLLRKHEVKKEEEPMGERIWVLEGFVDYTFGIGGGRAARVSYEAPNNFFSINPDAERTGNLHTLSCSKGGRVVMAIEPVPIEVTSG